MKNYLPKFGSSHIDWEVVKELAKASWFSYKKDHDRIINEWKNHDVHIIDSDHWNTRAVIITKNDKIIICFRGTELTGPSNLSTDLNIALTSAYPISKQSNEVHTGFLNAYNRVREEVRQHVERKILETNLTQVKICGHSLGGALANLCAVDLKNNLLNHHSSYHIELIVFGQPKVGKNAFARESNEVIGESNYTRFENQYDPIPDYPLNLSLLSPVTLAITRLYKHGGKQFYMKGKSKKLNGHSMWNYRQRIEGKYAK